MISLQVNNLTIGINQNILFNNLSFSLNEGQILGICQPTGFGKSTLLNYIAGILDESKFQVQGNIIKNFKNVSYIFQDATLIPNRTVLENVMLPIIKIYGKEQAENKALSLLHLVHLDNKCMVKAKNLSGGEKQRVAISRAFAYPGELLLMDEPFHSQDEERKNQLIELTKEIIKNENRMCILVSHTKDDFEKIGAQTLVFN